MNGFSNLLWAGPVRASSVRRWARWSSRVCSRPALPKCAQWYEGRQLFGVGKLQPYAGKPREDLIGRNL